MPGSEADEFDNFQAMLFKTAGEGAEREISHRAGIPAFYGWEKFAVPLFVEFFCPPARLDETVPQRSRGQEDAPFVLLGNKFLFELFESPNEGFPFRGRGTKQFKSNEIGVYDVKRRGECINRQVFALEDLSIEGSMNLYRRDRIVHREGETPGGYDCGADKQSEPVLEGWGRLL